MIKEYLVTETYTDSGKVVVLYREYTGEDFDAYDCGGSADVYKTVVTGANAPNDYLKQLGPDVNVIAAQS